MMTDSLLHSNDLFRVKDLLEKYNFNVEEYVEKEISNLYSYSDNYPRSRVIVSFAFK